MQRERQARAQGTNLGHMLPVTQARKFSILIEWASSGPLSNNWGASAGKKLKISI